MWRVVVFLSLEWMCSRNRKSKISVLLLLIRIPYVALSVGIIITVIKIQKKFCNDLYFVSKYWSFQRNWNSLMYSAYISQQGVAIV